MKKLVGIIVSFLVLSGSLLLSAGAVADRYVIDTEGMHAFVQFRVKHLGYSWLYGRFNKFSGNFTYDPKRPQSSRISLTIDTASINTNHAERDKHLRSEDFLNTDEYALTQLSFST